MNCLAAMLRILVLLCCALSTPALADGYLRAQGKQIVDETGRPVILRGMGLGGWMLQEGYMLQLGELGQQHVIRRRIAELIGEEKTAAFYRAWLDNYVRKADIDAMAAWGFNSVRLPIHYNLLTLPIEQESRQGTDTWHEDGFRRIDELLEWSKANGIYLILDLHAAPGGQGKDMPISDRDPAKPSLWDSAENRRKTVALWRKLAQRYADEPWIGGYDIINEPNWDFEAPGGGNGCKEEKNAPLRELMVEITGAIRAVDTKHMIIIEGNCWGNNYKGVLPAWDSNIVLSFHKYWNRNDDDSIASALALRDQYNLPLWLGESGENSNVWFRDSIALVERHRIGWAYWPLKKIGFNQPLEISANPGWAKLVAFWTGKGPKPDAAEAETILMRLAEHDIRFENNIVHPDVMDAMLRQPHSDATLPFSSHRIGAAGGAVQAVDYDMGPCGSAYFDHDDANYHVATGKERTLWNNGRTYRNDGVDIARDADGPYVSDFSKGEWMQYTIAVDQAAPRTLEIQVGAAGGVVEVALNGAPPRTIAIPAGKAGWQSVRIPGLALVEGRNRLILRSGCDCAVRELRFGSIMQ